MQPGERIGPWVVEDVLGEGAVGAVYRCHHADASRMVRAVKVLAREALPQSRARFVREAETLFSLRHPVVVSVVDVALRHDPPYLVMELVEGVSLETKLRRQEAMPTADVVRVFRDLAEGLLHAHRKGIRHRDLKPANLMLSQEGPKIVDFGLAVDEERTRLTESGVSFGTMSYIPPELFVGREPDDERRDVYALGVCLHEALSLKRAFPEPAGVPLHEAWQRVYEAKRKRGPLDPGPKAPEELRALVRWMTDPDPNRRARDMTAVISALDALEAGTAADEEQAVLLTREDVTNSSERRVMRTHATPVPAPRQAVGTPRPATPRQAMATRTPPKTSSKTASKTSSGTAQKQAARRSFSTIALVIALAVAVGVVGGGLVLLFLMH